MRFVVLFIGVSIVLSLSCTHAPTLKDHGMELEYAQEVESSNSKLVEYILATNPQVLQEEARLIASAIEEVADKYNLDQHVFVGLIHVESSFKCDAVSKKGAIGLMQINPKVWLKTHDNGKDLCSVGIAKSTKELFDLHTNLEAGAHILTTYLQEGEKKNIANPLRYAVNRYYGKPGHYSRTMEKAKEFKQFNTGA